MQRRRAGTFLISTEKLISQITLGSIHVRELQLNNTLNRPLNSPFWGTLKGGSEVPQNGGFRGLKSQCISLGLYFHATLLAN
jgi:hypothetical protein